jgi:hypothetical protein
MPWRQVHNPMFNLHIDSRLATDASVVEQCCTKRERRKHHFTKILGSGASWERLLYICIFYFYFLYIYCVYIKKNMQKDKLVAKYTKTCIFVH